MAAQEYYDSFRPGGGTPSQTSSFVSNSHPPPPYQPFPSDVIPQPSTQMQPYYNNNSNSHQQGKTSYAEYQPSAPQVHFTPPPQHQQPSSQASYRPQQPPRPQTQHLTVPILRPQRSNSEPPSPEHYHRPQPYTHSHPTSDSHRTSHSKSRSHSRSHSRDRSPSSSRNGHSHTHHHHQSHHHHHHSHSHSRSRSSNPTPKDHTSRDTFLGAAGGGVIGDLIFPGLGTVGGALLGALGGNERARRKRGESEGGGRRRRKTYEEEWEEGRRRRGEI